MPILLWIGDSLAHAERALCALSRRAILLKPWANIVFVVMIAIIALALYVHVAGLK